jgi:hypothetical protein
LKDIADGIRFDRTVSDSATQYLHLGHEGTRDREWVSGRISSGTVGSSCPPRFAKVAGPIRSTKTLKGHHWADPAGWCHEMLRGSMIRFAGWSVPMAKTLTCIGTLVYKRCASILILLHLALPHQLRFPHSQALARSVSGPQTAPRPGGVVSLACCLGGSRA